MKEEARNFFASVLVLLLFFVLSSSSLIVLVNAEPSGIICDKTFGSTDDERTIHDVFLVDTSDGGYALFGNTYSLVLENTIFGGLKLMNRTQSFHHRLFCRYL
jgi:hypothetical protein